MLIDAHHKKWSLITFLVGALALSVYAWFFKNTPGGLTGGSVIGLWYGVIGAALMIYAGLLSALRKVPSWWWIGNRAMWLRAHIWLGWLSGLFILCHSGFRWGGVIEIILWIVLLITLATGVLGVFLQQFLPRLITSRIASEAPYEQIPRIRQIMLQKADAVVEQASKKKLEPDAIAMLESFYLAEVRPYLAGQRKKSPLMSPTTAQAVFARTGLTGALGEELAILQTYCVEHSQLAAQERMYHLLHAWLLVHVPASIALLLFGIAHVYMALYY